MSSRLPATPRFRPQGHLLRTTALVSLLSTLASLQPGQAQQLVLDNASPNSQPLRSATGTWAASSLIWYNPATSQWEALANGGIAVLDAKQNNADVTLTIETVDPNTNAPAPIRIDGIQVNENGYTLTGGALNGTGQGLRFLTDDPADPVTIDVDSALNATVIVEQGVTLNYGGVTTSSAGTRVEAGAALTTTSTSTTRGVLTVIGNARVDGTHEGTVMNDGTLTLNGIINPGTVTGPVTNNAIFMMTGGQVNMAVDNTAGGEFDLSDGTVTGDVDNAGTFEQTGGTVIGTVTNQDTYLMTDGTITGDVANAADFVQRLGATIDGNVTSTSGAGDNYVLRGGEVTGNVTNEGLMEAYGRIGGTLTNEVGGSVLVNDGRTLVVGGKVVNADSLTLADGSTVTGDIDNSAGSTMRIDDATVTGSVTSNGNVYILDDGSEVTGDLGIGADGLLQLTSNSNAQLTVGGRLTSAGYINTNAFGDLTITADEILLLNPSRVEANGSVRLVGTEVVQGSKIFDQDQGLEDGLINGGILNEATGTVLLQPGVDVNGNGYAIKNFGRTELEGPGASLFNLQSFDNTGADARLIIAQNSEVYSNLMTNSGRITNGGTLSVTTGAQLLDNQTGGKLTNTGWVLANVDNAAGATLISSNRIDGDVDNDGIAYLSGTITGELDNSSADVTLEDSLTVGSLKNTGSTANIRVNRGQTLTSAGQVENSGTLTVAGDLDGNVTNSGTLTVDGELDGNVGNTGSLTSTGTITGDVTNDGTALLIGSINGDLTNHTANLGLTGNLRVGRLRNSGSAAEMTIAAGQTLTSDNTASNSGKLTVAGALVGDVTNSGTLNSTGTITGNVSNTHNLTSSGTITGNLDNDGTAALTGTITGELDNSSSSLTLSGDLTVGSLNNSASSAVITVGANQTLTSNGAVANDGTLNVQLDGTLAADGNITNNNIMTVAGTASTDGDVRNDGTLDVSGQLTAAGDLDNRETMTVGGTATIGGNVDNYDTLNVNGTLTADGAVDNRGKLNVNGDLTAGGDITNDSELNIAGSVTGMVINNDEMNLTGGSITGTVTNNAQTNVSGISTIIGDLTNTGTITAMGGATTLSVTGGTFLNDGVLNTRPSSTLTIKADALEFGVNSQVDASRVFLEGDIVNRGTMTYDQDASLNNGGLINKSSGSVVVSAALDADGNDITNAGDFLVTRDSNSTGNLHNVDLLQNSGTFTIDADGQVSANLVQNHSGTLTVAGGLTGPVSNKANGTLVLDDGTITGTMENLGTLTGNGTITGDLTNRKTADLGGSAGNTINSGVLGTNGNLTLGTLLNTGTVRVDAGDRLTTSGAVDNQRKLEISGTLTSGLDNREGASTELLNGGTIQGAVTNDGRLTGNGRVTGTLTNNNLAELAGSLATTVNEVDATLRTAGDLQIASLTNKGTTEVLNGDTLTMATTLQNQKQLTIAGQLVGSVDNLAGATTALDGGTIRGDVDNNGRLTTSGTGTVTGTVQNGGTVAVASGTELTFGKIVNTEILNVGGTLRSDIDNRASGTATLQGGRIVGDIANAGTLEGRGTVNGLVTNAGVINSAGTLTLDELSNNSTVNVVAGSTLKSGQTIRNAAALNVAGTLSGAVNNVAGGTVALNAGTITGALTNRGTVTGNGTLSGLLTNRGTADIAGNAQTIVNTGTMTLLDQGTLAVAKLTNDARGELTIDSGETLSAASRVVNEGALRLSGTLTGGVSNSGTLRLNDGTISGKVTNSGTLNGAGVINGTVTNSNRLNTTGKLTVNALTNTGTVAIGTGEALVSKSAVINEKTLSVAGTLQGGLNNQANASTTLNAGTVVGAVQNRGTLGGSGTVDGKLTTRMGGTTVMGGRVTGDLVNLGGTISPESDLQVDGQILNSASTNLVLRQAARGTALAAAATAPGTFTVNTGTKVSAANGTINGPNAYLNVFGTLIGDVENNGFYTQTGNLDGSLVTNGDARIGGTVSGNVDYAAGQMQLDDGLSIGGQLILRRNYAIDNGTRINAAETAIMQAATLSLGGTLAGNVSNAGTLKLADRAALVTGNVDNTGSINLSNDRTGDVLTVGGLSGNGTVVLDIDTGSSLTADRIVVDGGRATGNLHFSLAGNNEVAGSTIGRRVTLLDVDESFGAQNDIKYSADELSSAANERIVYSVDQQAANGDLTLVSQVNPAIGAMFANVTLVQSLIGSVINRPTSPYVTGLVVDSTDKPCGVGGWGRATGGTADVEGKTDNQVSVLENKVSADYYGMQGGIDLACFDDRYAGWDMAFGALGGVNIGDSRQPIYAINGRNSQATTGVLASITTTDFQQRYAGVYATASKDRWVADLQFRMEQTDFELKNKPITGTGLGITDPDFSSDGYTLSGSVSYSMPIAKTGWNLTPTVGFAWSKYSTESISFDEGFWMEFDDSERKIGFVGATVSKAFIRMEENAAIQTFATATYYKDFADAAVSRLHNDELDGYTTQIMTSDNLKSYTELSLGANYVKVLNPGQAGGGRQFSTSARIDGRFGENIDSVGVTGQIRWQF